MRHHLARLPLALATAAAVVGFYPRSVAAEDVPVASPVSSGWLGVVTAEAVGGGARVERTVPGSPADALLRAGDVIVAVEGAPVGNPEALSRAIATCAAGATVVLRLHRDGAPVEQPIVLAARVPPEQMARQFVGAPFPADTLVDIDGASHAIGVSPITIVEFWATWCGPCQLADPTLRALRAELTPDVLAIVGVSDEEPDAIDRFFGRSARPWPIVLDAEGRLARQVFVVALPTWVVLGPDGRVAAVFSGLDELDQLDAFVRAATPP